MHTSFQNSSLLPQVSPGGAVLWLCGGKQPSSSLGHPKEPGAVGEGCRVVTARGLWPGMCETVTYWYRKFLGVVTAISTKSCNWGRKLFPCGLGMRLGVAWIQLTILLHILQEGYIVQFLPGSQSHQQLTRPVWSHVVTRPGYIILQVIPVILVSNFLVLILLCLSDWAVVLK